MKNNFTFTINEIFYSIQGEGRWAGHPMLFVRFSGCNLSCPWCDTKHQKMHMKFSLSELKEKIILLLGTYGGTHVCFTGGEPTIQPGLSELIIQLSTKHFAVHVESNGTGWIPVECSWLTISPKRESGFALGSGKSASEVKMIVDDKFTKKEIPPIPASTLLYLQPQWGNPKALKKTIRLVKAGHGLLSLQMQKYGNFE